MSPAPTHDMFESAEWYDRGINWEVRLAREIPFLRAVFGAPEEGGLLDAGCGSGRHVLALAQCGYRVRGLDSSPAMIALARSHIAAANSNAGVVEAPFAEAERAGCRFDGVLCLGNSLAAAGAASDLARSVQGLTGVLRPGGRLVLQVLNFVRLAAENPAIRGPRVSRWEGREYISSRVYFSRPDRVEIVNVTMWHDESWQQFARSGHLYPVTGAELSEWLSAGGANVDALYGDYGRAPFDAVASNDLIVVATRR